MVSGDAAGRAATGVSRNAGVADGFGAVRSVEHPADATAAMKSRRIVGTLIYRMTPL
jgi:hypothetical protein